MRFYDIPYSALLKVAICFFRSNIKEVIRAVLDFLFFYEKISHAQKSTKSTKKHQKHERAQKRNQTKAQNANERTKIKNVLKEHLRGKK